MAEDRTETIGVAGDVRNCLKIVRRRANSPADCLRHPGDSHHTGPVLIRISREFPTHRALVDL
ncbi:MAG: hypothetical protein DWQ34_09620 [Planctomycetota bacterium]|nr:MAG: hypothetical protein DWQ29_07115 [Planctomycetota bacterium]REJ93917.1 MAG: hypothetical protein DWQ34_09620 [Planctomycetota bacterium]REK20677.1 MAG: hypothetical protein DWQ41_23805 [Planctomycetota bacterium]REK38141.1 MAG: hypothetical protein DWQ45_05745 [Planctomycetota bacterium]